MKGKNPQPVLPIWPRRLANLPIRRKLRVIIMGVTTAALLLAGLALTIFDVVVYDESLRRDLSGLAKITAENSTAALKFEDPQTAQDTLSALQARTHVLAACIFGADNTIFASYIRPGSGATCPPPLPVQAMRTRISDIRVSRPIMLADQRIGTLVLLYDLDELYQRMRVYGAAMLAIVILAGTFALLLSSRLQTVIAVPIARLARTTAAVSATRDYSIRAEKMTQDELGTLVDGFNEMLAGIQSRDQDVRQALAVRQEALTEARNARDFLRTTLASIGDAVISTDADGRVVLANAVACSLAGWREDEMLGRPLGEMLHLLNENTREELEGPVARVLESSGIIGLANHTVLIARDGSEIPIDDSAAPIRDHEGKLIGTVLIFRDITERRRAEQELRAAREQLQLVTDTMSPAVTHCTRDLRYKWVSPSYAEWLQRTRVDIEGYSLPEVLGPEAFVAIVPYIERVLANERVEYEIQAPFPRIGLRWIHAAYVPTHDRAGAVTGWVAHVSDITALKQAQAEVKRVNADIKRANERLARSNDDLERFAFIASHDLQEPLRTVTAYAQLLSRTYSEAMEGDGQRFIHNIVEGASRMRGLLADLLAYSEISGDTEDARERVDLNQVFETVRQNLKVAIEESGAVIKVAKLPVVTGYTGHFVQLFQNLVGNAIKYRGEQQLRIDVSYGAEGDLLRFAVADNGIGIDPIYHARIFGVFKRLHGKKIPGTGIGLAICQRVVERYHGKIWVESERGQGATFAFTLPSSMLAEAQTP